MQYILRVNSEPKLTRAFSIFIIFLLFFSINIEVFGNFNESIEQKLSGRKEEEWFKSFIANTNQKEITSNLISNIIRMTDFFGYAPGEKVLDLGIGEGVFSASIAKTYKKIRPNMRFYGIEKEQDFIKKTKLEHLKNGVKDSQFVQGDVFSKDLDKTPNTISLLIASDIAYYAPDINEFIIQSTKKLTKKGVAIYLHEDPKSDMNKLRQRYKANVNVDTVTEISKSLNQLDVGYYTTYINSHLYFSGNIYKELADLKYDLTSHNKTKTLLEFVVQTPLEILKERGVLNNYLEDVEGLLKEQNHRLMIVSKVHVVMNK